MSNELKAAIEDYCKKLTAAADNEQITYHCDYQGRKFVRIVRRSWGQDSAHNFVCVEDGSLWKPANWKGPVKNFSRGNVYQIGQVVGTFHGR